MRYIIHNIVFYLLVILTCILLIILFNVTQDKVLAILLAPHARLTEMFHNIPMTYANGLGYVSFDGAFAIGRECLGSKFIVIMFAMTACMFGKYFDGIKKAVWFWMCLLGSFLVGILVSCIRIVGSVPFVPHPKFTLLHSGMGISLYLFALIATYIGLCKLVRSVKHEKIL